MGPHCHVDATTEYNGHFISHLTTLTIQKLISAIDENVRDLFCRGKKSFKCK